MHGLIANFALPIPPGKNAMDDELVCSSLSTSSYVVSARTKCTQHLGNEIMSSRGSNILSCLLHLALEPPLTVVQLLVVIPA